jgi:hypothetical protein
MTLTTTAATASPKKLKSGAWGALTNTDQVIAGDKIWVTTKDGKRWFTQIERVLWAGDGKAICATSTEDLPAGRKDSFCDECGSGCYVMFPGTNSSGGRCHVCEDCYGVSHQHSGSHIPFWGESAS